MASLGFVLALLPRMIRLSKQLENIDIEYAGMGSDFREKKTYEWWVYDAKNGVAVGHIRRDQGGYVFWPGSNRQLRGPVAADIALALEEANRSA